MRAVRDLLLSTLTAATVLLAVWSWSRIATGLSDVLTPIVLTGAAVMIIGVALRALRSPRLLTVILQLAAAWSVASIRITHTPVPLPYAPRMRLENAFVAAGNAVMHDAPPVPVAGGVLPLVLCGAGLAFVLADVLARTLRLTAISGLVLLAVLAVPVSVIGSDTGVSGAARSGVSPWLFALVALGWLAQVVLAEDDRLGRWGRQVVAEEHTRTAPDDSRARVRSWAATAAVGGTATVLALVVPLGVPSTRVDLSGFGSGGGGNGKVTVTNPMIDVRQSLVQGSNVPLIRVRTEDPDPSYLRIAVLTRFNAIQWSPGDRSIPADHDAHGPVPIAGLSTAAPDANVGRPSFPYRISVEPVFSSRWLPTPAPITEIDAEGDWRYDTATNDFVAGNKTLTTAGLTYTATRVRPEITAAALARVPAGVGQVSELYTSVPADLPPIVGQLAHRITQGARTPLEQAVALQSWFRTGGGFTYSTDVSIGSGGADLATFLGEGPTGRRGYCQQFSAAMAAMARTLGIPARVAVGFLNPTKQTDGSYLFSSHDMHAWPELYFAGAGWVRFEPTPGVAGTTVPSYAHDPGGKASPTTAPSASAAASPSVRPTTAPRLEKDKQTKHAAAPPPAQRHLLRWLVVALVLVAITALLAIPATVRRRRRRTRLGGGGPIRAEDAWAELRDTAIDLGLPWSDGLSPRTTRDRLSGFVATRPGRAALDVLVDAIERERYAITAASVDPGVLQEILTGIEQGPTPTPVRRAAWWPRSVMRRHAAVPESLAELDRVS